MADLKAKEITLVNTEELAHHPKNTNEHPESQINYLCKLIEYQGFRNPLVVQKGTNLVVAGNGRLMAAKKLGLKQVPVMYQEFDNEAQIFAYIVSDNKIAELAEHNDQKMFDEIKMIPDLNLEMLGIPDLKLPEIFEPQCDEDEVPEFVEPKTKLGDLYRLGNHRLLCGDSTSIDAVEKLMGGDKAQTFFTDPPYGDNVGGLRTKTSAERSDKPGEKSLVKRESFIHNDKEIDWLREVFNLVPGFLKEQSTKMVFFKWDKLELIKDMAQIFGEPSALCVWDRVRKASAFFRFQPQHELCFHWGNQADKKESSSLSNVWREPKELENKDMHPTVKPIAILEPVIRVTTDVSEIVLDLFGGSGSTLIACEKTSRKCFMMELDPHYCDVIVARWEKFTGKKAELLNQNG